jgi:ABC-type multidrug transport system ATPase subunit
MDLSLEHVGKRYTRTGWALRDFQLRLDEGILGLLGPNGAGKSTLMRILATVTQPSEGRVLWNGSDIARAPDALRAVLGYLPQDFGVYPHLSALEFLHYLAALKGLSRRTAQRRIEVLLEVVNLGDARKRPLASFSGGMKRRVGIAQALLNDPRVLIVDEPTAGLDPEERARFRTLLADLASDRVIILSTHIVSDVEATATTIALIHRGRLVLHATPEQMLRHVEGRVWEWVVPSADLPTIRARWLISAAVRRSDGVHLRVVSKELPGPGAQAIAPTLEDAYLYFLADTPDGRSEQVMWPPTDPGLQVLGSDRPPLGRGGRAREGGRA